MWLHLTLLGLLLCAATATQSRIDPTRQRWAWRQGSESKLLAFAKRREMRIIDIEILSDDPPRFAAVFVDNRGDKKIEWFLYTRLRASELVQAISKDDSRVIDFDSTFANEKYGERLLTAVAIRGKPVVWQFGTRSKPNAIQRVNGGKSEILDVDSYKHNGVTFYTYISTFCEQKCTRKLELVLRKSARFIREAARKRNKIIVDIERHENGKYSAVLETLKSPVKWAWLRAVSPNKISKEVRKMSARVYDLEPYKMGKKLVYDVLVIQN